MDQPFQYDGPVGSYGRPTGFLAPLFHCCVPYPSELLICSLFVWRLISGSLYVCSFHAPHVGIQFWRTHPVLAHACSLSPPCFAAPHRHPASPRARDSNIWFPFFQIADRSFTTGRCTSLGCCAVPAVSFLGVPEPSHSLSQPIVVALDIILSTPTFPCRVTVHAGSNCCSLAPLCCPLLSSDHMLCSLSS